MTGPISLGDNLTTTGSTIGLTGAISLTGGVTIATNGGTATFNVVASGSQPLTYQWQFNGSDVGDGTTNSWSATPISGSATTNLTITGGTTNDQGSYTVVVANDFGSVTSNPALLTIGLPPKIISWPQPNTVSVPSGTTTNFYVVAAGTPPLAYQWQLNNTNLVASPTTSSFSGFQSPMSKLCDTMRVPGFSSLRSFGRSLRFTFGKR